MFNLTWPSDADIAALRIYIGSQPIIVPWVIPKFNSAADREAWIAQATYPESGSAKMGSLSFGDEQNTIQWGPTLVENDNWCVQEAIEGHLDLDMSDYFLTQTLAGYKTTYQGGLVYQIPGQDHLIFIVGQTYEKGFWDWFERIEGSYPDYQHIDRNIYSDNTEIVHLTAEPGRFKTEITQYGATRTVYNPYAVVLLSETSGFSPNVYVDRYRNLTNFVRLKWRYKYAPNLRTNNFWFASLDAVKGFHPYDLNLVEGILQFSMEDICPKGTSSSILSLLTDAVNSKGGLLSPSGIVYGAQIFANVYLYHKYVASANVSDISSILVGDDKASMIDIVKSIKNMDPDYVPEQENWRLKRVAEIIVHRGHKLISSYGTDHEDLLTELGEARRETRARLRAWPRYYDDMSTAAIICEEFGLSLTAERLVAVVPYEFIAQWFVPIEENIRSIEYNRDRLQMMYKVQNLCLSEKVVVDLDMNYLKAMFGLSDASGQLYFKTYSRRSQREFPPTALDLNLHPSLNLSRVLQGTSLIVSRI